MSWLFGIIGPNIRNGDLHRYRTFHDTQIYEYVKEGSHYFAGGGNIQTCFSGKNAADGSFWMGLGIILQTEDRGSKIYSREEWSSIAHNAEMLKGQNGHYVLLTFDGNLFNIQTDALGLRTIYWAQIENEIVISTRMDWIAKYRNGSTVDYRNTGSRWLLFNQLSYRSLVKETNRLGPNGKMTVRNNRVTFPSKLFTTPPRIYDNYFERRCCRVSSSISSAGVERKTDIAWFVRRTGFPSTSFANIEIGKKRFPNAYLWKSS